MDHAQRSRQQRGQDFQDEIRRSWKLVPNCWRMRIADGRGGTRPADEIILLQDINVLAEHKRTQKHCFEFSFLEVNQVKGLLDFDHVIERNKGLVFVSFLDDATHLDLAVTFKLRDAMLYMRKVGRKYITQEEFKHEIVPCLWLPRVLIGKEKGYNLKGVNDYFVTDMCKK